MKLFLSLLFILSLSACKNQESTRNDLSSFNNYQNKASNQSKNYIKKNTKESGKIETKKQKKDSTQRFVKRGKKIALATKKQLGKNLMEAISEKGVAYAVEFCNVQAMPITQKMEKKFNASVKRVSDKNRNPQNEANEQELAFIEKFKLQLENNVEPNPEIVENKDKVNFYYPIVTNSLCLKCHGEPKKNINRATFEKINKFYPKDQAVNYTVNEVRGMWHIEFDE